jgi:hypothetical protein
MSLLKPIFVTVLFLFVIQFGYSQRNYDDYNKLGITGGVSFFDINTTDLITEQGTGLWVVLLQEELLEISLI